MVCEHCSTENPDGAKFCYKCGRPLAEEPTETAAEPEAAVSVEESVAAEAISDAAEPEQAAPRKKHKVLRWLASTALTFALAAVVAYGWLLPNYYPSRIWEGGASQEVQKQVEEFVEDYLPAGSFSVYGNAAFNSNYVQDYAWLGENDLQRAALRMMGVEDPRFAMRYDLQTTWTVSTADRSETLGFVTADTMILAYFDQYSAISDFTMDDVLADYAETYVAQAKQEALEAKISLEEYWTEYVDNWYTGGYDRFIVDYAWTNTTDSATSPSWDVTIEAYQDGVALERDYAYDQPYGAMDKIAPGQTVQNSEAFIFRDSGADVTVVASEYLSSLQEDPAQIVVRVSRD